MPLLVYSVRRKCHHSSTSNIHMPQSSSSRIPVAKVSVVNHYCLKPLALVFHLLYQRRFSSQKNKGTQAGYEKKATTRDRTLSGGSSAGRNTSDRPDQRWGVWWCPVAAKGSQLTQIRIPITNFIPNELLTLLTNESLSFRTLHFPDDEPAKSRIADSTFPFFRLFYFISFSFSYFYVLFP